MRGHRRPAALGADTGYDRFAPKTSVLPDTRARRGANERKSAAK